MYQRPTEGQTYHIGCCISRDALIHAPVFCVSRSLWTNLEDVGATARNHEDVFGTKSVIWTTFGNQLDFPVQSGHVVTR